MRNYSCGGQGRNGIHGVDAHSPEKWNVHKIISQPKKSNIILLEYYIIYRAINVSAWN